MDRMLYYHPTWSTIPPADRQNLSHRVDLKDYGNPDCLHKEGGKRAVMRADRQAEEVMAA
jgi:hypothetical protein